MTAYVQATNYSIPIGSGTATTVEYEPKIGGFSFGSSGLFTMDGANDDGLQFESYGVRHVIKPNYPHTWASYTSSPLVAQAYYFAI